MIVLFHNSPAFKNCAHKMPLFFMCALIRSNAHIKLLESAACGGGAASAAQPYSLQAVQLCRSPRVLLPPLFLLALPLTVFRARLRRQHTLCVTFHLSESLLFFLRSFAASRVPHIMPLTNSSPLRACSEKKFIKSLIKLLIIKLLFKSIIHNLFTSAIKNFFASAKSLESVTTL